MFLIVSKLHFPMDESLLDIALVIPPTPWGYIIEDIVREAVSISMKLGVLVRVKVLYSPDDGMAVLSIGGNEVVFRRDGGKEITIETLVDIITMYSIPTSLTRGENSLIIAT